MRERGVFLSGQCAGAITDRRFWAVDVVGGGKVLGGGGGGPASWLVEDDGNKFCN